MESTKDRMEVADEAKIAFRKGRQAGLGTAALALSIVSFISLLGLEKAILAAVLGLAAWRGAAAGTQGKKRGWLAVIIAGGYAVFFGVMILIYHDKFAVLIRMLQQLG